STGRFADIQVDASPSAAGVVLRFITAKTFFVGRVSVEGSPDPPNTGQLATAAKLELGSKFSEPEVGQATDNILERLRANGLYGATVSHTEDVEPRIEQLNIDFTIDPGKRARFGNVSVE